MEIMVLDTTTNFLTIPGNPDESDKRGQVARKRAARANGRDAAENDKRIQAWQNGQHKPKRGCLEALRRIFGGK